MTFKDWLFSNKYATNCNLLLLRFFNGSLQIICVVEIGFIRLRFKNIIDGVVQPESTLSEIINFPIQLIQRAEQDEYEMFIVWLMESLETALDYPANSNRGDQ